MCVLYFYDIQQKPVVWGENFPKGYGHTSIAYLKRCPTYSMAKRGNLEAARMVVQRSIKPHRVHELVTRFPKAILLPVIGCNAIPIAMATEIGLPVWEGVYRADVVPRKSLPAIARFLHKPVFKGRVRRGVDYVIVDDVITQGGTVAALREYVLENGGNIVAVVALAYSVGSHHIAPTPEILKKLHIKFGYEIFILQNTKCVRSFEALTQSQIRYLLRFKSVKNICNRINALYYYPAPPPPLKAQGGFYYLNVLR